MAALEEFHCPLIEDLVKNLGRDRINELEEVVSDRVLDHNAVVVAVGGHVLEDQ